MFRVSHFLYINIYQTNMTEAAALNPTGEAAEITAPASVRLPTFIQSDPELWFVLAEQTFIAQHITSDRVQYASVVLALNTRQLNEVRDVCMQQENPCSYTRLKTEMLKRFGETQLARIRRLLELEQIGDRRPSQFLRHLRGLAGAAIPDDTLRAMWLGRLPAHIRHILVVQEDAKLDRLADLADAVLEHASPLSTPTVSNIAHTPAPVDAMQQRTPSTIDPRDELIATLREELTQLRLQRPRYRGRSTSRARPRAYSQARQRTPSRGRPGQCWYHATFREKARKCTPPCNFQAVATPPAENFGGSRQ